MNILFGPNWRDGQATELERTRLEMLLNPPPGSPSYAESLCLDDNTLIHNPRPATDEEREKIAEVREMQAKIRERVGAGKVPSEDDMCAVLTSMGTNWGPDHMKIYMLAANTMDQGVQIAKV